MGRKSKREGTGCVRRADSLCCTAETSTRLESNYTPVKIWRKKKNCLPHAMKTELEIWALTSLLWNEYLISGLKPHRARTGRAVKKMKDLPPKEEGELPQVPQQLLAKSGSSWVPTARFGHRSASLRGFPVRVGTSYVSQRIFFFLKKNHIIRVIYVSYKKKSIG